MQKRVAIGREQRAVVLACNGFLAGVGTHPKEVPDKALSRKTKAQALWRVLYCRTP